MLDNLLVCIGAQKAGTSWLHSVLKKDNRFSQVSNQFTIKEIHYFDYLYAKNSNLINDWRAHYLIKMMNNHGLSIKDIVTAYLQGESNDTILKLGVNKGKAYTAKRFLLLTRVINDDWYEEILKCNDKQIFSLDITPDYSIIGTKGFLHMQKVCKNLKILFILRNPVERAWSGVLQDKKGKPGGVNAFLESENIDVNQLYNACTKGRNISARTDYKKTLKNIYAAGLKENLKILFYDHISEQPEIFIDSIYDFIGMDNSSIKSKEYIKDLSKKVYVTEGKKTIPEELESRLKLYYRDMLIDIKNDYNIEFPSSWLEYYDMH